MRLMVVDDDVQIREGITYGIQWENLGIREAVCFKNAFEALEGFKQKSFDIVLLDISMPGMTGIELLQELKSLRLKTAVVLISGYEEFEYAQAGLRYGAADYILKPIHLDKLMKTIRQIVQKYRKEQKDALMVEETERSSFVRKLFHNVKFSGEEVKKFLAEECGFPQSGIYVGALLRSDLPDGLFLDETCLSIIIEKMAECFAGFLYRYFVIRNEELYLLIHTYDSALYIFNLQMRVKGLLGKINSYLPAGRSLSIALPAVFDGASLKDSYQNSVRLLEQAYFMGPGCFVDSKGEELKKSDREQLEAMNRQCVRQIQLFEKSALETWLKDVKTVLCRCTKEEAQNFVLINLAEIMHMHHIAGYEELRKEISSALYFEQMMACWTENLIRFREEAAGVSDYSREVRQAIDYIRLHYMDKLTVERIAEKQDISAGHLSRLFKMETGVSVKKYLNKVRIEKAIYLLQNTNKKVYEIAEEVGIPDYLYFSQVFKSISSKTPLEIRRET